MSHISLNTSSSLEWVTWKSYSFVKISLCTFKLYALCLCITFCIMSINILSKLPKKLKYLWLINVKYRYFYASIQVHIVHFMIMIKVKEIIFRCYLTLILFPTWLKICLFLCFKYKPWLEHYYILYNIIINKKWFCIIYEPREFVKEAGSPINYPSHLPYEFYINYNLSKKKTYFKL